MWRIILLVVYFESVTFCQEPFPSSDGSRPPRETLLQCDLGVLRETWDLGSRIFGLCMSREDFIAGSKLLMKSRETELLAWYGLAFDYADLNDDGHLSVMEFMRAARDYYGRLLNIPIAELRLFYGDYLSVNGSSPREVIQRGLFNLEMEQIRGRQWDKMNSGSGPCLHPEEYMAAVCETALFNSRHAFRLFDFDGNHVVSRDEFHNATRILGFNDPMQEVHWRMLDTSKNGYIEKNEAAFFTALTLQVF